MAVTPGDLTGLRSAGPSEHVLRFRCALAADDASWCASSLRCIVDPAYTDDHPGRVVLGTMSATADDPLWTNEE